MKKFFSSLILIFLLVLGFVVPVNVSAETRDVYNIVTCPGEDMATQMQINWQSDQKITDLKIEYTTASDLEFANKKTVEGAYHSFSRQDTKIESYVGFETPRNVWRAPLNDLTPETNYIYRIVNSKNTVMSKNYHFETASKENKDFSFLFMTDPQYYEKNGSVRFNEMAERHIKDADIKFAFLTGDITDRGGNSNLWDMFYEKSSLAKIPYVTTVGNHEYYDKATTTVDNSIYNNFYYNPENGVVKGSNYWCTYNGVLFILIDSEDRNNVREQQEWFRNVCDTVPARYIIVGAHRSPYAGAEYYEDGLRFKKLWCPIFDECNVDLVLTGHDHMYARTKILYDDKVCMEKYKGTTYILGGSAGTKYYPHRYHENEPLWAKWFDRTTVSTVVKVTETGIQIECIDYDGNTKDKGIIPAKRFGNVDPAFTKEEFEKSFSITTNKHDSTSGAINWSPKGYGHVKSLEFTNLNSGKKLGATQFINDQMKKFNVEKGFNFGEVNKVEINIHYVDGTTAKTYAEVDNSINWGSISNLRASEVKSDSVTFTWDQEINPEFDYVNRVQIYRDGNKAKNSLLKSSDLKKNEYSITIDRSIKPDTKYEFKVEILNINGTPIWPETITVVTPKEMTYEEIYQNNLGSLAIKAAIDNLLKAMGAK